MCEDEHGCCAKENHKNMFSIGTRRSNRPIISKVQEAELNKEQKEKYCNLTLRKGT
jgi:hypothetical protein